MRTKKRRLNNKRMMKTVLYGLESESDTLPLVLINCDEDAGKIYDLCKEMGSGEFILAALNGFDWNRDLSPWPCDPVFKGGEAFQGKADAYLSLLSDTLLPQIETEISDHGKKTAYRVLAGYSLAGLFALYSACSSDLFTCADAKAKQTDTKFDSDTLQFFCPDASGKATLVLQTYGNEHATHLMGMQKNGKTAFDTECGEKIRAASRSGSYSGVLTDTGVLTYNNAGSLVGTLTLKEPAQDLCLSDRTAYVLFPDRIERFPAAGTHEQTKD